MTQRILFTVTTPLGNRVRLSRDRWRTIIRFKHPALAGQEQAIRQCLARPLLIRSSEKDANVYLHYVSLERGYLCVVTAPTKENEQFVVTAYYTKDIKKGNELWRK